MSLAPISVLFYLVSAEDVRASERLTAAQESSYMFWIGLGAGILIAMGVVKYLITTSILFALYSVYALFRPTFSIG